VRAAGREDKASLAGGATLAPLRLWYWEEEEVPKKEEICARLSRATAAEIARLLTGREMLAGRCVRPSDIAVLTATNEQATAMQIELRRFGVPSALLNAESVFHSREAGELLTVLHAVAQPRDARRLRAALLTDLLGLDMRQVHAAGNEGMAWEAQAARFHTWHEAWQKNGFSGVFRRLLRDTGARGRLLARDDGERRLTNLSQLAELLQRAALEEQLTPPGLVKWLSARMSETERVEEHEMRLERDDEAVRIVTVHKSKGLEYNIVFCPFLWTKTCGMRGAHFHFHDVKGDLVFDLGDEASGDAVPRAETESLAEGVRLLYVALTRARHRCDLAVGRFPEYFPSALNWVLQGAPPKETWQSLAEGDLQSLLHDHYAAIATGPWRERLEELSAESKGNIAITPVPEHTAPRYAPEGANGRPARAARKFSGEIERDFAVSSFSSLTAEGDADHPERFAPPWTEEPAQREKADDIHAFPSGARTGTCLHEIFEELDFTDLTGLELLVGRKLLQHGFDAPRWTQTIAGCVRDVLAVKLAGDFSLGDIPAGERLIEREFHLPAHRLEARRLQQLMGGEAENRLEFAPRTGWLKGYIDLVFRQGERFYVVDWKSNRLGPDASGYNTVNVAAAMASHHYPLQAQIYGVALHRYLDQRLRDYDYERHFGGMIYLFVRGISPSRPGEGIWQARPKKAEIEAFHQWLEGA
jgi:exodeoxyribonuclease V beta subunit